MIRESAAIKVRIKELGNCMQYCDLPNLLWDCSQITFAIFRDF